MTEDPKAWGHYVESAVGAYICKSGRFVITRLIIGVIATMKLDFVLHRRKTIAIEVKSGRRTTNNGLPKFEKAYHPYRALWSVPRLIL